MISEQRLSCAADSLIAIPQIDGINSSSSARSSSSSDVLKILPSVSASNVAMFLQFAINFAGAFGWKLFLSFSLDVFKFFPNLLSLLYR